MTMYEIFIDVLDINVLIIKIFNLGKSELKIELILCNLSLITNNAVKFTCIALNIIKGECLTLLQNLLKIRGLCVLNIKVIFNETAIRHKLKLKFMVWYF